MAARACQWWTCRTVVPSRALPTPPSVTPSMTARPLWARAQECGPPAPLRATRPAVRPWGGQVRPPPHRAQKLPRGGPSCLPRSRSRTLYQMAAGLPRAVADSGSECQSSISSQSNAEEAATVASKHPFLSQSSTGASGGGGSSGDELIRCSGEFTRRQLSLTEPQHQANVPRQNSAGPQRRIDQPPPAVTRGRTPPNMLSTAPYPRPSSGSMMSSSPDWPSSSTRLRQQSSSSKGDSPETKQRTLHKQVSSFLHLFSFCLLMKILFIFY